MVTTSPGFRLSLVQPRRLSSVTALVSAFHSSTMPALFFTSSAMMACGFENRNSVTLPEISMVFVSSKNTANEWCADTALPPSRAARANDVSALGMADSKRRTCTSLYRGITSRTSSPFSDTERVWPIARAVWHGRPDGGGVCGMNPRPATRVEYRTPHGGCGAPRWIWSQICDGRRGRLQAAQEWLACFG